MITGRQTAGVFEVSQEFPLDMSQPTCLQTPTGGLAMPAVLQTVCQQALRLTGNVTFLQIISHYLTGVNHFVF